MIKNIVAAFFLLCSLLMEPAFAQTDFSTWDKRELRNPVGTEMLSPADGPLIRMHSYSIANLENESRRSLKSAGAAKQGQLEYALSILGLSMIWDESFDGDILSGLVQASDGPYSFKAQFSPDQKNLTLALVATDDNGKVLQGTALTARRTGGTATSASYIKSRNPTQTFANTPRANRKAVSSNQNYAPPETAGQMDNWTSTGKLTKALNPSDPLSPRYYLVQTGPKYGVFDFQSAISKLPTASKLKLKGRPVIEELEAWQTYDGSSTAIVMQQTKIENQDGVIVLFMTKKKGRNDIVYFGYEVTEDTYLDWGGITRMMKLRKVIPTMEAFPKSTRDRISRAPFKQQAKLYEAGLNKVLENGLASMYAMSQTQTLMRMQELNYDLLLGGDITSPMISD